MVVNYKKIWKLLGGKFLENGPADMDSININTDYKEALRILGCKFEETSMVVNDTEYLSLNMQANHTAIPSCKIIFNRYQDSNHADNPSRVEAAIYEAIKEYGKKLNSKITYIGGKSVIVWLDFKTEADAKKVYDLITKKYSELDEIYKFLHRNL